jgi:AcrR family transcriptional regulator
VVTGDVFDEPANTREAILAATYRSLRKHGYADLTIQRIGDELDRSPSLIYHHYEDKDALVLACLESLLDHFESELGGEGVDEPRERLEDVLEWWFGTNGDEEWQAFVTTMLELRTRSIHDPDYRTHFTRSDRVFGESVAEIVRAGIETGEFRECDPDAVAETLQTTILGSVLRLASGDDDTWLGTVHAELGTYLEARVYPEGEPESGADPSRSH